MTFSKEIFIVFVFFLSDVQCESYWLKLRSTAPAIDGVNVTFIGDVWTRDGHVPQFNDRLDWVRTNSSYYYYLLFCYQQNVIEFRIPRNVDQKCYVKLLK